MDEIRQELGPRRRVVVRAERIPQMSYVELAQVVRNLMLGNPLVKNSYLVIDAGGPGRAFCDLLNTRSVLDLSRYCSAPLRAHSATKEISHGNTTIRRIQTDAVHIALTSGLTRRQASSDPLPGR